MEQTTKSTPKDVFSYLLMIVMLYVSVVSILALLFQYVNVVLPDQLDFFNFRGISSVIQRSTASLIVVWPVYLLMSWLISKDARSNPLKRQIKVRRWLLYLTLFISAVTIIVDLITLVFNFLGGELSPRFVLKVIAVLIVAAAVFGYYLWDLRRDGTQTTKLPRIFAWVASGALLLVIILGFFVAGSPAKQRQLRFDEQRVSNLQMIQNEIINYWQLKDALPENLAELNNDLTGFSVPQDPASAADYEYQVTGELSFELCAEFELASQADRIAQPRAFFGKLGEGVFKHGAGRECFERTIDPELFKNNDLRQLIPLLEEGRAGQVLPRPIRGSSEPVAICENLCGDGICQEIVCLATGCPCAESADSCPQDCSL